MAKPSKSDPTKGPKFQKVVQHFLKTPPKPHKSSGASKDSKPSKAKPKPR